MRITLAQINPTIGDLHGNIGLMRRYARSARDQGADLVVFPELSLTGYYPGDLLDEKHFQERLRSAVRELLLATRETPDLAWVVGLPLEEATGTSKRWHNGLQVIQDGHVLTTYRKQLLPTYDVFDERRHFAPGPDTSCILRIAGTRVGFLICEDGWNSGQGDYIRDPWVRLASASPDVVISINASPWNRGKRDRRHAIFSQACQAHQIPLIYVNQVGGHDQLVYDGASFAMLPDGQIATELPSFQEGSETLQVVHRERCAGAPASASFTSPDGKDLLRGVDRHTDAAAAHAALTLGLRDYARRCGFTKALVGCSGGVDSALALVLACDALGSHNVTAITMPSRLSSSGSVLDSQTLCARNNIELLTYPISDIVDAFDASSQAALGETARGLARENLQPRIRATILMTYSNTHGHLLLTTGNKSESMVGFCTLGGDTMGGLNILGDLYKTEVWEMCRHINAQAGFDRIPREILEKAPSAELAEGQLDSQRLPEYAVLDTILKSIIESGRMEPEEQTAVDRDMLDVPAEEVEKVKHLIAASEYKRRQSPPILRVRARAIGSGRQVPIAAVHF